LRSNRRRRRRRIRRRTTAESAAPGLGFPIPSTSEGLYELRHKNARVEVAQLRVREVKPDLVSGQVWMPRLFEKVCVG